MRTVVQIFLRDLKRVRRNGLALAVVVGIAIIPALYAWFSIAANWDPYGNTKGISVAVANMDRGYSLSGLPELNIGGEIAANLKENGQIGWELLEKSQAISGVKSGQYYAAILIPEDFSEKLSGAFSAEADRPEIIYYINEKKNAVAPKITDKGVSAIQQKVNSAFIQVLTETISKKRDQTLESTRDGQTAPMDNIMVLLESTDQELGELETSVHTLLSAADTLAALIDTTRQAVPNTERLVQQGDSDGQGGTASSQEASISMPVEEILRSGKEIASTALRATQDAFQELSGNGEAVAGKLEEAAELCNTLIDVYQKTGTMLTELDKQLPAHTSWIDEMTALLEEGASRQQNIVQQLQDAAAVVRPSGELPLETRETLIYRMDEARGDANYIEQQYLEKVRPQLQEAVAVIHQSMEELSGLLAPADSSLASLNAIFDGMGRSATTNHQVLEDTETLLDQARKKIQNVVQQLNAVSADDRFSKLIEILEDDPAIMGNFMASPVQIDTQTLYPIEHYGSAMAPFHSTLALWLGGILLVAVLKIRVDEDNTDVIQGVKPWHAYLGRQLLFLALGLLQATVICLVDLYILGIQCRSPFLFLVAGWISSLVFTNIIYTLTASFGNIGKALCVLLLVVQTAVTGSVFPIEVMPQFIQNIDLFLPFTYGINAMRETVAGIYKNEYLFSLLHLLAYIPLMLILGLLLRRPFLRMNGFFKKRLEDTKLM